MLLEENRHLYGSHDKWASRLEFIWKDALFENRMDRISDYVYANSEGRRWDYGSIIGHLLLHKSGEMDVAEKQEKWIQHTIELHSTDHDRMYALFAAIEEHSETRRRRALETLLRLNNDYALFEILPLEASSWGGSGSMIPYMQERITYLESLKPLLTGVERLQHKQKVEHDIRVWKSRIKSEEVRELLDSLG